MCSKHLQLSPGASALKLWQLHLLSVSEKKSLETFPPIYSCFCVKKRKNIFQKFKICTLGTLSLETLFPAVCSNVCDCIQFLALIKNSFENILPICSCD